MSADDYERPIGPWPRKVRPQGAIRLMTSEELRASILYEDEHLLVVNKAGDFVCHPSKDGPWSSLVGAAREYLGGGLVHLIFRLDRETSGVVVIAKDERTSRGLHTATQERRYAKIYYAILTGELATDTVVDQPLGKDLRGPVMVKNCVVPEGQGQKAVTRYTPLAVGGGFTLARVTTETGRMHQIRAHAQWLGHWLVGDKVYGPDQQLFLDFLEYGWTPALEEKLFFPRQALHCAEIDLTLSGHEHVFRAPLHDDMRDFIRTRIGEIPAGL
ncbi:MAG: RluA family pseudouridine synthase [Nibricoccus sp.]